MRTGMNDMSVASDWPNLHWGDVASAHRIRKEDPEEHPKNVYRSY